MLRSYRVLRVTVAVLQRKSSHQNLLAVMLRVSNVRITASRRKDDNGCGYQWAESLKLLTAITAFTVTVPSPVCRYSNIGTGVFKDALCMDLCTRLPVPVLLHRERCFKGPISHHRRTTKSEQTRPVNARFEGLRRYL